MVQQNNSTSSKTSTMDEHSRSSSRNRRVRRRRNRRVRRRHKSKQKKSETENVPNQTCTITSKVFTNYKIVDSEAITNVSCTDMCLHIEAVKSSPGRFYRKRNPLCYHINLNTFIKENEPIIFASVSYLTLTKQLDHLTKSLVNCSTSKNTSNCLLPVKLGLSSYSPHQKTSVIDVVPVPAPHFASAKKSPQQPTTGKSPKRCRTKPKKKNVEETKDSEFPDYLTEDEVSNGLDMGELILGYIRINPRNVKTAYVNNSDKTENDYIINSVEDRNRSLEGDEVVLRIKPEAEWEEGNKTATVVYIRKLLHSRTAVGKLTLASPQSKFACFIPRDKRFPKLDVPSISWPVGFKQKPELFEKNIFLAKLTNWTNPKSGEGIILENIGVGGTMQIETKVILKEYGLDTTPFPTSVLKYLTLSNKLLPEWLVNRQDIRNECVFTIDPLTARDLDDAVSCKELENGNFEIGVHIADVSFMLDSGTPLDEMVCKKATTVYMVDSVYHMLPVELCMQCSLLPGEDKLSFSVFWEMTRIGQIVRRWFARTVMNSCCQLAYEHAQQMIENPCKTFTKNELPPIFNGYTASDLSRTINNLQSLAVILRQNRVDRGSLRIDQIKLSFRLNPESGEPEEYFVSETKEANKLIEEFMLLANISVAEFILESFPNLAFLRLHEPPKSTMLTELKKNLEYVGIHIDITSSKTMQNSLNKYLTKDPLGQARMAILNHLFAKPMQRAKYYCAKFAECFEHFALSIPLYTHFTSPIRRYADIMVHRLLSASLGYCGAPMWTPNYVDEVAGICNTKKYDAKRAGEASVDLYLAHYIKKNKPFIRDAVIIEVKERSFDVLVLETGTVARIYNNKLENCKINLEKIPCVDVGENEVKDKIRVQWRLIIDYPAKSRLPARRLVLEMFTSVMVELTKDPKKNKLQAILLRPIN